MKLIEFFRNKTWPLWLPSGLAILGAVFYFIQAALYARTSIPGLDEGSYLLKGILYLRGVYTPFQDYGPLTNKAPFAFLIPGWAEYLFGAGLRTGRYFSIFLGGMTVLGTWITARRWAGKWFAALTVWVFALSPMVIKIHAITASEVIVAAMLAWICVFVLAEERSLLQILLGAALAACVVLTRQNMALVLPLLILYIFWQHGKSKGLWALGVGSTIFLAVHAYYWPNILIIWAPWLPEKLTPFLDAFRMPKDATPIWNPTLDFWNRLLAFFQGVRYHFIPVVGSFFALLIWARPTHWKSASAFRAAVFLAVNYFILFGLHAWAAVASQYESYSCVFCFTPYLTFFDPLGILLTVIVFSSVKQSGFSVLSKSGTLLLTLVLASGIGYSLFETIGPALLNLPLPRMRAGQILPGTTLLVDFLKNKFLLDLPDIKRIIATILGAAFSAALALILLVKSKGAERGGYPALLAKGFLILGLALSPLMNYGGSQLDCNQDLLTANEKLGAYLNAVIPAGSLVYWEGGLSFTPLVYVPNVRIFPPQINDGYTFRIGGDPDTVFRLSHWNETLDNEWRAQADIFIVEVGRYKNWSAFLSPADFEEYPRPTDLPSCRDGAALRIFHKLP